MGYAGGRRENPTYQRIGDHTETLQVDYDPEIISYGELLEIFWDSHNPFIRTMSQQYKSIIFTHDGEQERLVEESKKLLEKEYGRTVKTEIVPYTRFYLAEDYHQKYYLQGVHVLMKEFMPMFPRFQDFVDSTAAARLNAYVAGYGDARSLSPEAVEDLGLSDAGADFLQGLVRR